MKRVLFSVIVFLLLIPFVYADDYVYGGEVDITGKINYSIIDVPSQYLSGKAIHVRFTGMSNIIPNTVFSYIDVNKDGNYICRGEGDYVPLISYDGTAHLEETKSLTKVDNDTWDLNVYNLWMFVDGYDTFMFGFYVGNTCYKSTILNIDRSTYINNNLPPVNERYTIYPDAFVDGFVHVNDETVADRGIDIDSMYPYDNDNLQIKYGLIKDMLILDDLKNDVSGVYERVIEYAKNDSNGTTFDHIIVNNGYDIYDYSDIDVEKNAIYYFYIKYKDHGRQSYNFHNTDGIVILQGTDSDNPRFTNTVDYSKMSNALYAVAPDTSVNNGENNTLENNNNENNNGNNKQTGTVVNPSTGLSIGIIGICLLLIVIVLINKYNKKKLYKL